MSLDVAVTVGTPTIGNSTQIDILAPMIAVTTRTGADFRLGLVAKVRRRDVARLAMVIGRGVG